MDTDQFWTGIADVSSDEFPEQIRGSLYRVVTFATDLEAFEKKVREILSKIGHKLVVLEEPEVLTDFLRHDWVQEDDEIYEMMQTSQNNKENVVCGDPEYYNYDEA